MKSSPEQRKIPICKTFLWILNSENSCTLRFQLKKYLHEWPEQRKIHFFKLDLLFLRYVFIAGECAGCRTLAWELRLSGSSTSLTPDGALLNSSWREKKMQFASHLLSIQSLAMLNTWNWIKFSPVRASPIFKSKSTSELSCLQCEKDEFSCECTGRVSELNHSSRMWEREVRQKSSIQLFH